MRYSSTPDANWPSREVLGNQSSRTSIAALLTAPSRSIEKPPKPTATRRAAPKAQVTFPPIELRRIERVRVRREKLPKLRIIELLSTMAARDPGAGRGTPVRTHAGKKMRRGRR